MNYTPKVGDTVRIKDYIGMLHTQTVWVIKEVRPDLSRVAPYDDPTKLLMFRNTVWIDNDRLIKVIKKPSK